MSDEPEKNSEGDSTGSDTPKKPKRRKPEVDILVDSAGNDLEIPKKPTEEEVQKEVTKLTEEEQHRRQWCVGMALQSWSLEVSENNFVRVADKIYEYIYGRRMP